MCGRARGFAADRSEGLSLSRPHRISPFDSVPHRISAHDVGSEDDDSGEEEALFSTGENDDDDGGEEGKHTDRRDQVARTSRRRRPPSKSTNAPSRADAAAETAKETEESRSTGLNHATYSSFSGVEECKEAYHDRSAATEEEILNLRDELLRARQEGSSAYPATLGETDGTSKKKKARLGHRGEGRGREPSSSSSRAFAKDPFPLKLHRVLDEVDPSVVSWLPHGRAFIVRDTPRFVSSVMPNFFKQTKITSFQRQLNLYGFCRILKGNDAGAYYHELFLRGKVHLCRGMIRTKVKGKGNGKKTTARIADQQPDFYKMPPVSVSEGAGAASWPSLQTSVHGSTGTGTEDSEGEPMSDASSPPLQASSQHTEEQQAQASQICSAMSPVRSSSRAHGGPNAGRNRFSFHSRIDHPESPLSSEDSPNKVTPSPIPVRYVEPPVAKSLHAFVAPPPIYGEEEEQRRRQITPQNGQSSIGSDKPMEERTTSYQTMSASDSSSYSGPIRVADTYGSQRSSFEQGRIDGPNIDIAYEPQGLSGSLQTLPSEEEKGGKPSKHPVADERGRKDGASEVSSAPSSQPRGDGAKRRRCRENAKPFNYLDKFDPVLSSILSDKPGACLSTSPLSSAPACPAEGQIAADGLWYDHLSCDFGDYLSAIDKVEDDVGFGILLENFLDDA